ISNEFGFPTAPWGGLLRTNYALGAATNVNSWSGYIDNTPRSFVIPLNSTSNQLMTFDNFYSFNQRSFLREGLVPNDPANQYPLPHWWLNITNRVLCALVDTAANRIIDYVNLSSVEEPVDIMDIAGRTTDGTKSCEGGGGAPNFQGNADNSIGFLFCTNRVGGSISPATQPYGIKYQVDISRNPNATSQQLWDEYNAVKINDKEAAGREFLNNLAGSGRNAQAEFDAPFSPARVVQLNISWQANDPLVHYTVPDLTDLWPESFVKRIQFKRFTELPGAAPISSTDRSALADLSNTNAAPLAGHYHPWTEDLNKNKAVTNATARRMELKDPMVNRSDNWNFPTNKLPGIGWLGRVHRGTPWQTMYLKSPIATNAAAPDIARAANDWMLWSGHVSPVTNYIPYTAKDPIAHYPAPFYGSNGLSFNVDFFLTSPTNDYPLLDLFTTAFNDNASRGQLSVNQTNLAAWSALLSGVTVVTNGTNFDYTFIAPAGVYNTMLNTKSYTWPPLVQIWEGINRLRTNTVLHHDANGFSTNLMFPGGSFTYAGDILRAPELSVASPYLTNALTGSLGGSNALNALTDEVYERIPQQILSLVRADQPRFVVYAFGQALRPAEHSIVPNGPFSGLVTNYAVTAESAIRAVVRVDGAPLNPHVVIESYNALGPY
ncbi:MAG TPA: hypothetical protein VLT36_20325, partial [Candidatus Dormibacteraeota bacterium]|nr:hypothetical protein [Candidatus Dormibacteraeota bacterium]